ncbi:hypothetical protein [Persicobacter psychrovividus]|uniref:Helix-turn-helix type 11 domain-containing protein n=1 Tax=Persicobacter psychrovividus TaxID=387638 RepID=A0ABM7VM57_9BACT|nr:hypothetical protein PEPS_43750 [Persicobacter psychrovividus]
MNIKQEIILQSYRDRMSQRQIAHELEISRKTVKKYLVEFELLVKSHPNFTTAFRTYSVQAPAYDVSNSTEVKMTKELQDRINALLTENDRQRKLGLGKQLLNGRDIYDIVLQEGYSISYSSVCAFIFQQKRGKETGGFYPTAGGSWQLL